MSRLYGAMRQIAFVVPDLDEALRYWTETLGVGPFYVMREVVPERFHYRGRPSPPPRISIALGNSGAMQVELIQTLDEHPSAYRDFLEAGRPGFQHVSSWLTRAEYDETRERMLAAGAAIAHEGVVPGANVRFAYFDTDRGRDGLLFEIADVAEPPVIDLMKKIAAAARDWDGRKPVRDFPP